MVRIFAIGAAFAAAAGLTIDGASPALARSSGMSAVFPVGTCIGYRNDHLALQTDNLLYVTVVPCTDPAPDYRVTAQGAHASQCDPATDWVYTTRDLIVLCVVQDPAPPVFGG